MKIAAVTDDGKIISAHFGRATKYAVYTVEDGQIGSQELRNKLGHRDFAKDEQHSHDGDHIHVHQHDDDHDHDHHHGNGHGHGKHSAEKHRRMFAAITDCDILLARGMGQGAYIGLEQAAIKPIITDIADVETAVNAVVENTIVNHTERLH